MQISDKRDWDHCAGVCNPADLGSRGITPSVLMTSRLCWEGHHWLVMGREHWPKQLLLIESQEIEEEKKKERNVFAVTQDSQNYVGNIIDPERYSTVMKLYKVTFYVLRFLQNTRLPKEERNTEDLTAAEIQETETLWIKGVVEEETILTCKRWLGNSDLEI